MPASSVSIMTTACLLLLFMRSQGINIVSEELSYGDIGGRAGPGHIAVVVSSQTSCWLRGQWGHRQHGLSAVGYGATRDTAGWSRACQATSHVLVLSGAAQWASECKPTDEKYCYQHDSDDGQQLLSVGRRFDSDGSHDDRSFHRSNVRCDVNVVRVGYQLTHYQAKR